MGLFLSGTSCSDAHVRINDTVSFADLDLLAAFCTSPVPGASSAGCWEFTGAAIALPVWGLNPGSAACSLRLDILGSQ